MRACVRACERLWDGMGDCGVSVERQCEQLVVWGETKKM